MTKITDIEFRSVDGKATSLAKQNAKVFLIVNVASKCGLTPQYEGLERIYEKYESKGLGILGFPANEFAGQEPGTNAEIQAFCTGTFGVRFPVYEKIVVRGAGQHPLYQSLTAEKPVATQKPGSTFETMLKEHGLLTAKPGEITWNFEKFLVNKKGEILGRFAPDLEPENPILTQAIEGALALAL